MRGKEAEKRLEWLCKWLELLSTEETYLVFTYMEFTDHACKYPVQLPGWGHVNTRRHVYLNEHEWHFSVSYDTLADVYTICSRMIGIWRYDNTGENLTVWGLYLSTTGHRNSTLLPRRPLCLPHPGLSLKERYPQETSSPLTGLFPVLLMQSPQVESSWWPG